MGERSTGWPHLVARLVSGAACCLFLWEMREPAPQIDDAYISYRYARNLLDGHGLVWNVGERVEGITNLLWTLLIALGMAAGASAERAAHGLATVSGLAVLVLAYATTARCLPVARRWLAAAVPWLVLSTVAFPVWCRSGLETPLFAAWAMLAVYALSLRRPGFALAAVSLATVTRPDGALLAVPLIALSPLAIRRRQLIAFGAVLAALTVFRLAYYGAPLPNTFYAKVGGMPLVSGARYLLSWLLSGALFWLVVVGQSWRDARDSGVQRVLTRVGMSWCLLFAAYSVWVGGDAFWYSRFFVVVLAPLAALAVIAVAESWSRSPSGAAVLGLGMLALAAGSWLGEPVASWLLSGVLACSLAAAYAARRARFGPSLSAAIASALLLLVPAPAVHGAAWAHLEQIDGAAGSARPARLSWVDRFHHFTGAMTDRKIARILAREPTPAPVAAVAIGRLGYGVPVPVVDILGLTEPQIARAPAPPGHRGDNLLPGHQRSNAAHVLSRAPALILVDPSQAILPAVRELTDSAEFTDRYRYDRAIGGYRRLDASGGTGKAVH